jgi:hypothetical protein
MLAFLSGSRETASTTVPDNLNGCPKVFIEQKMINRKGMLFIGGKSQQYSLFIKVESKK